MFRVPVIILLARGGAKAGSKSWAGTDLPPRHLQRHRCGRTSDGVPAQITFTASNWSLSQTVVVAAVENFVDERASATSSLSHVASSADSRYGGLMPVSQAVGASDNDAAGFDVIEPGVATVVGKGGPTDTFIVRLTSHPTARVTASFGDPCSPVVPSPASVALTSENWKAARTITVAASDDKAEEGPHTAMLTWGVSSADAVDVGRGGPAILGEGDWVSLIELRTSH